MSDEYLMHTGPNRPTGGYKNKNYDPVKAHEYYEKHKGKTSSAISRIRTGASDQTRPNGSNKPDSGNYWRHKPGSNRNYSDPTKPNQGYSITPKKPTGTQVKPNGNSGSTSSSSSISTIINRPNTPSVGKKPVAQEVSDRARRRARNDSTSFSDTVRSGQQSVRNFLNGREGSILRTVISTFSSTGRRANIAYNATQSVQRYYDPNDESTWNLPPEPPNSSPSDSQRVRDAYRSRTNLSSSVDDKRRRRR